MLDDEDIILTASQPYHTIDQNWFQHKKKETDSQTRNCFRSSSKNCTFQIEVKFIGSKGNKKLWKANRGLPFPSRPLDNNGKDSRRKPHNGHPINQTNRSLLRSSVWISFWEVDCWLVLTGANRSHKILTQLPRRSRRLREEGNYKNRNHEWNRNSRWGGQTIKATNHKHRTTSLRKLLSSSGRCGPMGSKIKARQDTGFVTLTRPDEQGNGFDASDFGWSFLRFSAQRVSYRDLPIR